MQDSPIKSIPKSPLIPGSVEKREREQAQKQKNGKKKQQKKDPERIIDTYA